MRAAPPAATRVEPSRAGLGPLGPIGPRRHGSDGVRLALATLLIIATAILAGQPAPTSVQINVFRLINELPDTVGSGLLGIMQAGSLPAVAGFAVVALFGRRRLAPLLAAGGVTAWAVARGLAQLVGEKSPALRVSHVVVHGGLAPTLAFPSTHVAVVAAMVTVARGELGRPVRRLGWMVVGLVGLARMYAGAHLPVDILGGLGVGWAVGALINLVVGVRPAVPDAQELTAALQRAGIAARVVRRLGSPTEDMARFVVETSEGWQVVKALGRDNPEEDWLRRAWRFLAFRQLSSERTATSASHRVDQEAYVSLLAERAGARVPPLSATWSAGATELIERPWIPARPLRADDAADGPLLRDLWEQLDKLERIGIAHRVQPSRHVVVDDAGRPWVVDLGAARAGATSEQIDISRAAALADVAEVVGTDGALSSFVDGQGLDRLRTTLPHLNLVEVQSLLGGRWLGAASLDQLRTRAAALCGEELAPNSPPVRVATRNLLPLVVAGIAVFVLLTHVGQAGTAVVALRHARPVWVVAAMVAAAFTYLFAAGLLVAAAPFRLDYWRTVSAQFAGAAANRASPAGLGGMALNLRYMEMSGGTRIQAVSALAVISVVGFLVHTTLTVWLVAAVGRRSPLHFSPDVDASWPLLAAVIVVSSAAGAAIWYWRLHRRLARLVRSALEGLGSVARRPLRLLLLLASTLGVSVAYAFALDASVIAAGGHLGAGRALTVYFAASAIGALSPTPGGLGTLEAALVAGLSQQGVATGPAVAGVLTYRVITYWLPVLPGLAFLSLLKRRSLL